MKLGIMENIDPDKEFYERKIVIIFLPINLNVFWVRK